MSTKQLEGLVRELSYSAHACMSEIFHAHWQLWNGKPETAVGLIRTMQWRGEQIQRMCGEVEKLLEPAAKRRASAEAMRRRYCLYNRAP